MEVSTVDIIQATGTPLIGIVLWLMIRSDKAIHAIDKRLTRVETKIEAIEKQKSVT